MPLAAIGGGLTSRIIYIYEEKWGKMVLLPMETEEEKDEELEFEGTIEDIDGSTWTMTIDGETRLVDVSGAEIEAELKLRGIKGEAQ